MSKLSGKITIVTGSSSGIGAAIATLFRAEGATVEGFDRIPPSPSDPYDGDFHHVDVSDSVAVEEGVRGVLRMHSRIDVLVNAAGIADEVPFLEMDTDRWNRVLNVDLGGTFLMCRHVAPHMVREGTGRIINISSQLGIKGGLGMSHYITAKAGVIGFTKALARELVYDGVLVNSIAPGPITSALTQGLSSEWRAEKRAELPLGRFGRPEEVAPSALLLASSPDGDLYVGQTLGPNSGDVMP